MVAEIQPAGVAKCSICDEFSRRLVIVNGVEVGRCITCDTRACPKCQGRTLDPTAKNCRHCGAHIRLRGI